MAGPGAGLGGPRAADVRNLWGFSPFFLLHKPHLSSFSHQPSSAQAGTSLRVADFPPLLSRGFLPLFSKTLLPARAAAEQGWCRASSPHGPVSAAIKLSAAARSGRPRAGDAIWEAELQLSPASPPSLHHHSSPCARRQSWRFSHPRSGERQPGCLVRRKRLSVSTEGSPPLTLSAPSSFPAVFPDPGASSLRVVWVSIRKRNHKDRRPCSNARAKDVFTPSQHILALCWGKLRQEVPRGPRRILLLHNPSVPPAEHRGC